MFSRRVVLAVAGVAGLGACTRSFVSSTAPLSRPQELQKVLIVVQQGVFLPQGRANQASVGGNRQMAEIAPRLRARLPAVFQAKGIAARAIYGHELATTPREPGEKLLVLVPTHAGYGRDVGQGLGWRAELRDAATGTTLWHAEVFAKSLYGAELDDGTADDIGAKLVAAMMKGAS